MSSETAAVGGAGTSISSRLCCTPRFVAMRCAAAILDRKKWEARRLIGALLSSSKPARSPLYLAAIIRAVVTDSPTPPADATDSHFIRSGQREKHSESAGERALASLTPQEMPARTRRLPSWTCASAPERVHHTAKHLRTYLTPSYLLHALPGTGSAAPYRMVHEAPALHGGQLQLFIALQCTMLKLPCHSVSDVTLSRGRSGQFRLVPLLAFPRLAFTMWRQVPRLVGHLVSVWVSNSRAEGTENLSSSSSQYREGAGASRTLARSPAAGEDPGVQQSEERRRRRRGRSRTV